MKKFEIIKDKKVVDIIKAESINDASLDYLSRLGYKIKEIKPKQQRYFFSSHLDRNKVKVGDEVNKYETQIGTIGDANSSTSRNDMSPHDHFGCMVNPDNLPENALINLFYNYIYGWKKEQVERYYLNPHDLGLDFSKIYPDLKKVDVGGRGYDFLQSIKNSRKQHIGYHPAVDVNEADLELIKVRGGYADFGKRIMAPCDGKVIHEVRTWEMNHGWGNVIIIKEN